MRAAFRQTRVAVVEDDEAVLSSLQFSLEAEGFEVWAFERADEALRSGLIEAADCLVVDHGLPEMNGLDLVEAMRARRIACPAVVITGELTPRFLAAAERAHVRVLPKPDMGPTLAQTIHAAIAGS